MLITRDGLHFLEISRVATAPRPTFTVSPIDFNRSVLKGREVREAIEYEKDKYILCCYDDKFIYWSSRTPEGTAVVEKMLNPSGGEYYRALMRISGYHAIRMPYIFMRDDKAISLINTKDKVITMIANSPFDYWAPLTMEVSNLSDPAGAPMEVIIHALE
jgi:hypothetical protein